MTEPKGIKPFPEHHVWIPTKDGKFSHRPVTKDDKQRRGMVLQLITHPHFPRGTPQKRIDELMVGVNEEKAQILLDLDQMRWPCHE